MKIVALPVIFLGKGISPISLVVTMALYGGVEFSYKYLAVIRVHTDHTQYTKHTKGVTVAQPQ